MDSENLVEIYRAGDVASAAFLQHLLEERGVPVYQMAAGMDGIPAAQVGIFGFRILVRHGDVEAHAEEIAAALREYETSMGIEPPES
jgi:hypothetical protein